MDYKKILNKEFERSGSQTRIRRVPVEKRPTVQSLKSLDREINSQISANDAMRSRSMKQP